MVIDRDKETAYALLNQLTKWPAEWWHQAILMLLSESGSFVYLTPKEACEWGLSDQVLETLRAHNS